MQTELYSLSKIFTENLFRIPDYQRGYSWRERQLKDFWGDILLLDDGRDHYTGVLTLEQVDPAVVQRWTDDAWIIAAKRYTPYYVVDGQQRLTTSLILMQCILEAAGKDQDLNYSSADEIRKKYIFESRDKGVSRSYIFGYERDNPSYEFLKTKIFMETSDSHTIGEETIYTQNLLAAKQFFQEKLAKFDLAQLESAYTKLTQRFLYNIYVISGDIDVFVAFESMNNRGKPLSHLELLKNRLIYLSTRLDVDSTERTKTRKVINECWKTAYHFLGRNKKNPLNDDHFLFVQFLLYIGVQRPTGTGVTRELWHARWRADDYKEYLLDKYFTSRNLARAPDANEVQDGAKGDGPRPVLTADLLYQYAHDMKRCVETYYRLLNPEDSSFGDEIRIHLARLRRLGWRDGLPLAVAIVHRGATEKELAVFLQRLERHLFIQMIRFQHEEELDLMDFAIRVAKSDEAAVSVADKIHAATEKRASKFDFSDARVSWSRGRSYYGWHGLKYFLFEYEQDLKKRSRADRDKLIWDDFMRENYESDYSTIEHIYPQRPRDSYWADRFGAMSVKHRNAIRNSLGNLLPVSQPKNAALSNRPFPEKRDGFGESAGYRLGSYAEIEVAQEADWTPDAVLHRGLRLLEFLERRWHISVGDRQAKIAALGLIFLETATDNKDAQDEEPDLA